MIKQIVKTHEARSASPSSWLRQFDNKAPENSTVKVVVGTPQESQTDECQEAAETGDEADNLIAAQGATFKGYGGKLVSKKYKARKLYTIMLAVLISFMAHAQAWPATTQQNSTAIKTNIYQNPNHAITGQVLQNVLMAFNGSTYNIKTDTEVVLLFDSVRAYYLGQKILAPNNRAWFGIEQAMALKVRLDDTVSNYYVSPLSAPLSYYLFRCDTSYFKGAFDTVHFKLWYK